jgi:hypothetical protein
VGEGRTPAENALPQLGNDRLRDPARLAFPHCHEADLAG